MRRLHEGHSTYYPIARSGSILSWPPPEVSQFKARDGSPRSGMKFVLAHGEDRNIERNRFSEERFIAILKGRESEMSDVDLCCELGFSDAGI